MRILFLARENPWPPTDGEKVIAYNLLRQLSKNHRITLITFRARDHSQESIEEIESFGIEVELLAHPGGVSLAAKKVAANILSPFPSHAHYRTTRVMEKCIRKHREENEFDIVHVASVWVARYKSALKGLPSVLNANDARSLQQERMFANNPTYNPFKQWTRYLRLQRIRNFQKLVYSQFSKVCVVAQPDANELSKFIPRESLTVIPIGVDTDYFACSNNPPPQQALAFSGAMSYLPNQDAVLFFYKHIWPQITDEFPQITFYVVGRNPNSKIQALMETDKRIIVTGTVEDIRSFVYQSTIYVSPLRVGSGMKIKLLEAMSMGKPIVATPLTCDGFGVTSGTHLLIREHPTEFADAVKQLLRDPVLRHTLSENAREYVVNNHSWERIVREYEGVYREILASRKRCSPQPSQQV